jgi:PTH2 family peptidyl-tRNA hydrolase
MDEYVQYYVVNKGLEMSKGKMSAQVAHGATISAMALGHLDYFKEWFNNDQKKVVLQGSEKDMHKILANVMDSYKVIDNGLTEIPEGSMTVVVLPPMKRSQAQQYVKRLQLYKG